MRRSSYLLLLLPEVADTQRLADLMAAKKGIDATHVLEAIADQPDQICIHYESGRLSIGEVRELAYRAGAQLQSRFGYSMITDSVSRLLPPLADQVIRKAFV